MSTYGDVTWIRRRAMGKLVSSYNKNQASYTVPVAGSEGGDCFGTTDLSYEYGERRARKLAICNSAEVENIALSGEDGVSKTHLPPNDAQEQKLGPD